MQQAGSMQVHSIVPASSCECGRGCWGIDENVNCEVAYHSSALYVMIVCDSKQASWLQTASNCLQSLPLQGCQQLQTKCRQRSTWVLKLLLPLILEASLTLGCGFMPSHL